jgi:hypothetical protein
MPIRATTATPICGQLTHNPGDESNSSDSKFHTLMFTDVVRIVSLALALGSLHGSIANSQRASASQTSSQPTAGQEMKQGMEENLATIVQSRSTNSRGYKVVIHNDGSAMVEIDALRMEAPRSQEFPPGTIDTKTLRRLLTEVGDVSRIPIGNCAKSVSFGTRTQIAYAGKTSGDLQCIREQALDSDQTPRQAWEDLSKFVRTTLSQLKIGR